MEIYLTDLQILGTLFCAVLFFIAWKLRLPMLAIIPSIGFFYLGLQIYDASEELLILGLYYFTAIVMFVICFGKGVSSRR